MGADYARHRSDECHKEEHYAMCRHTECRGTLQAGPWTNLR
jgi:hypothetical protein